MREHKTGWHSEGDTWLWCTMWFSSDQIRGSQWEGAHNHSQSGWRDEFEDPVCAEGLARLGGRTAAHAGHDRMRESPARLVLIQGTCGALRHFRADRYNQWYAAGEQQCPAADGGEFAAAWIPREEHRMGDWLCRLYRWEKFPLDARQRFNVLTDVIPFEYNQVKIQSYSRTARRRKVRWALVSHS